MTQTLTTWLRLSVGFLVLGFNTTICMLLCVLLLPFRTARIKVCNYYGKLTGPLIMKISGCPLTIEGTEHLDGNRPAIYISNHTSIIDIFLAIFLSPIGTVGVAKKQVVYYPFLGQLYYLSGHLRIDRGKSARAKKSMNDLGDLVRENALSIYIWPEGTRSRSGRLLPFKKGIIHLAEQTGLPIVPIVITGAHEAWVKNSMRIAPVDIHVQILPAIDTTGWTGANADEHLVVLQDAYKGVLPSSQQPAEAA